MRRFGWDWERWVVASSLPPVQNGRHVFRLFGRIVLKTPTVYLGRWWDDDYTKTEPDA